MSENITECLAEIERLRAERDDLRDQLEKHMTRLADAPTADINNPEHVIHLMRISLGSQIRLTGELQDRIAELEAELALARGSLAPHPADDEPGNYTHDVPPSAPR